MGGGSVGVLLVNLGSPEAPTPAAVRTYLRQFLSDRRVVDLPPLLWRPLLELVILPRRSPRSAELYRRVWEPEGSPLVSRTRAQARALGARLFGRAHVGFAMRYGGPSIESGLRDLIGGGADELLVVPMFPQYAEATSGSVVAEVGASARRLGWSGPLALVPSFPTDGGYVEALAARCRESAAAGPVDHHVFSFHGLPQKVVERGDPYRRECEATARALATRLGLADGAWTLVFQSRFGPAAWLQPYADVAVPAMAARFPRLLVSTPGFTADCLETIDEIGVLLAERFAAAGGRELRRVPCLDAHPAWIDALEALVRRHASSLGAGSAAPDPAGR